MQDRFELKPVANGPPTSIPRNFSRQGYWLRSTVNATAIPTDTVVLTRIGYSFQLSDLPGVTQLTAVFDQYCIVAVVARITLSTPSFTTGEHPGRLCSVIDHDDHTALTTLGAAGAYPSCLETEGTVGHTRVIEPRFAAAAYSGTFTSYANTRGYIDSNSIGVQHYGLKLVADVSVGGSFVYSPTFEYIVHFRDVFG